MPLSKSVRKLLFAVGGFSPLALSGCYDPYYVGGSVGYQTPYVGTVVSYQQPWYDYYYYPSVGVYFNYRSGYYYHHNHGRWNRVRRLPRHIHIHDYDRVRLRMRGDRPYLKHQEHRRKYKGYGKHYKHESRSERKYDKRYAKGQKKQYRHESGRVERGRSGGRHYRHDNAARREAKGSGRHGSGGRRGNSGRNSGWRME